MFDTKSDYALNKMDPKAIVYIGADGILTRLTLADFSSPEEFQRWKAWSDGDYKGIESAGRGYYDNCVTLAEALNPTDASAEDVFFTPLLKAEDRKQKIAMLQQVKNVLTETQYRRLWLYYVQSMTVEEIAVVEHIAHQNVSKSIRAARKKIKKFLRRR